VSFGQEEKPSRIVVFVFIMQIYSFLQNEAKPILN
jgi:hypothetical protein